MRADRTGPTAAGRLVWNRATKRVIPSTFSSITASACSSPHCGRAGAVVVDLDRQRSGVCVIVDVGRQAGERGDPVERRERRRTAATPARRRRGSARVRRTTCPARVSVRWLGNELMPTVGDAVDVDDESRRLERVEADVAVVVGLDDQPVRGDR